MGTFSLGQKVRTVHGEGTIVKLSMPFNGLYISLERSEAVVWYGTDYLGKWVSFTYCLSELEAAQEGDATKMPKE